MTRIPLTLVPSELRHLTNLPVPSYRAIYTAVLDGRIPAKQGSNGRWTVSRDDLPRIVAEFVRTPAIAA